MDRIIDKCNYKNKKLFMFMMVVLAVFCFCKYYTGESDSYNTTILALNYTIGFTSRGLIGTIFLFLDKLLPVSIMNVAGARFFLLGSTLIFFLIIFLFKGMIIKRSDDKSLPKTEILMTFFVAAVVSTFADAGNFGRVDMYMIAISILCVMLMMWGKAEWLIIPLTALGVMIHQGYVFMYFNIVIVVLFYKLLSDKNKRIKYIIILALSIVICAALFFYFELFSHADNGEQLYESVAATAASLDEEGEYHKTLLAHELLGVDLSEVEHEFHMKNLAEIILFALFLFPYIIMFFKSMIRVFKSCDKGIDKLKYAAVYLGSLTMLPDYLIKVDYGRWVLSTIVYYITVFFVLIVYDKSFREIITSYFDEIKVKYAFYPLFIIYPILFVPYFDVNIDQITAIFGHVINREFLHWWTF